jgi:hypothetical protein
VKEATLDSKSRSGSEVEDGDEGEELSKVKGRRKEILEMLIRGKEKEGIKGRIGVVTVGKG